MRGRASCDIRHARWLIVTGRLAPKPPRGKIVPLRHAPVTTSAVTQVKYVEMLERYEHEQARALEKEPIPAEQRESIRRYFDALKPPVEPEPSK